MNLAYNKDLTFRSESVQGIPILICSNQSGEAKPLVICSHGLTSSKEFWKEYLRELAQLGYYAVAVDNRLHGQREGSDYNTLFSDEGRLDFNSVFKAVKETADDIVKVIDYFSAKSEIENTRIAMMGVSMGGFTTYRATVLDKRIKVAIPIISSPVWGDLPENYPANEEPHIIASLKHLSKQYAPSNFIDKFYPTALLMQVGGDDKHFDLNKLKQFYQDIKQEYENALHKVDLIVYDGIEHEFVKAMWDNAKSWLNRFL